jgi:hypothetical protein
MKITEPLIFFYLVFEGLSFLCLGFLTGVPGVHVCSNVTLPCQQLDQI